jgi:hypothetical protein
MGRKKNIKTEEELREYQLRRRIQNRINQRNYRLRIKLKNKVLEVSSNNKNIEFKNHLSLFLKEKEFNYFITLTTKYNNSLKKIKHQLESFLNGINLNNELKNIFYVIEKKSKLHIHLLIKTEIKLNYLIEKVKKNWNIGYSHTIKIYSDYIDRTLENYLLKEVRYDDNEFLWGIN